METCQRELQSAPYLIITIDCIIPRVVCVLAIDEYALIRLHDNYISNCIAAGGIVYCLREQLKKHVY